METWGHMPPKDFSAARVSFLERSKITAPADFQFPLELRDLDVMENIHRRWSLIDSAPKSFLSDGSDQTMVEAEESSDTENSSSHSDASGSSNMDWEVGSSASCEREPQRRLFPSELQQDPFPSNDEDAISCDSHITDVEGPDDFATALVDYETDRSWLKGITSWAEGAAGVGDEAVLLNDEQINEDPREQPRVATSLDLEKPDYLSKIRSAP
jgi:hypothetical protein